MGTTFLSGTESVKDASKLADLLPQHSRLMPQNSWKQWKVMADVYTICDTTNLKAVGISEVHFILKRI